MKICHLVLFFLLAATGQVHAERKYADVKLTFLQPTEAEFSWQRENQNTPKYPIKLAKKMLAGCSILNISINEDGKATIEETLSSLPNSSIGKESRKLIRSWKWQNPTNQAGNTATVRLDYCLGGSSTEEAQQRCLRQSMMRCTK